MGQVTIYLDDETEQKMRKAAESAGISQSRWIADLIHQRTRTHWPDSVRELAGKWPDFPESDALREPLGTDTDRESL